MKGIREIMRSVVGICYVQTTGLCLIIVSLVNIAGYITGFEMLYKPWPGIVAMALTTALCFLAIGASLVVIGEWRRHGRK